MEMRPRAERDDKTANTLPQHWADMVDAKITLSILFS